MSKLRVLAVDQRIVGALADGPLSAREITAKLRHEVWAAWAEKHGFDFEWETSEEPVGARAMAFCEADSLGLPFVSHTQAPQRLVSLEKRGRVQRIQLEGHRPILWRQGAPA